MELMVMLWSLEPPDWNMWSLILTWAKLRPWSRRWSTFLTTGGNPPSIYVPSTSDNKQYLNLTSTISPYKARYASVCSACVPLLYLKCVIFALWKVPRRCYMCLLEDEQIQQNLNCLRYHPLLWFKVSILYDLNLPWNCKGNLSLFQCKMFDISPRLNTYPMMFINH